MAEKVLAVKSADISFWHDLFICYQHEESLSHLSFLILHVPKNKTRKLLSATLPGSSVLYDGMYLGII